MRAITGESFLNNPAEFRESLLEWLPKAPPDEVAMTRHQLVDIAGYVKRYSKSGMREALRAGRLTEWEMAHRWPVNPGTANRTDDRPLLHACNSGCPADCAGNVVAWQRVYAVGRADRERLLEETDPNQLTQAAVIRWTTPPRISEVDIRQGDAREVLGDIEDASVDLILTDPPYGGSSRELYTWLGEFGADVLKPSGSLVAMTGQSYLGDDIDRLGASGLRYWWTLCQMHGASQRLPGKFVMCGWKPALWFVKGARRDREMISDVLRGKAYDKDEHEWAQGDGVDHAIRILCPEGGLIVDPFAGTGRWGELAVELGRRWIGADVGGPVIVV